MRRSATFDSSFWVHLVHMELVDCLLEDYELFCPAAVEKEFALSNPTSIRLKALIATGRIKRADPKFQEIKLYGSGERAAINLALERKWLLFIDDWRPFEAAKGAGVETVNSLVFLMKLYDERRVSSEKVLDNLARMTRRGTIRPEWIQSALKMAGEIKRRRGADDENG